MTQPSAAMAAVLEALRAQNIERAADLAQAALARGESSALFLNLRAWRAESKGDYQAALDDLQTARALAPEDISTLNALGLCLANLQRHAEALEPLAAAIALKPDFAPAHFNRGWVSEELGELDQARAGFEAAMRLNARDPTPIARLAALAARAADWPRARSLAEHALALQPHHPTAVLALAAADNAEGRPEAARQQLTVMLADLRVSPIDRAQAQGLMGDALEKLGRPAEAFAQFAAANATLRALHAPRFTGPGVQTVPDMLRWLQTYFEAAPAEAWRGAPARRTPDAPSSHVFLLGFPRSGTTLLERVLSTSPAVAASEERETLTDATIAFMRNPASLDRLAAVDADEAERRRDVYWEGVRALGVEPAGQVFIDKLPLNTIKLPLIAKLFPNAKVLFALRDPRDVVLSCFRQRFRVNPSMFEFLDLESAARFYGQVMTLAETYRTRLAFDVMDQRYEDLVGDFEGRTRAVCEFIGLDWSDDMRRFDHDGARRSIATPSATQVARGLYDGGGQWRAYAAQLAPALPHLRPWIERYGYPAG